jgi:hypothetical protein
MTPTEEARFVTLWQQGLTTDAIAEALSIPPGTARSRAYVLQQAGKIPPRPKGGKRVRSTPVHPGTPGADSTRVHRTPPTLPAPQSTPVHPSPPLPNDLTVRLLSLLPDLEAMVTRERDRQQRLSTPLGTPQHTVKKTYVIEALYVDLIERYAADFGMELKDVLAQALFDFFAR